MKNRKSIEDLDIELEKFVRKTFSYEIMSNSKWLKLIQLIINNSDSFKKIEFKKVLNDEIGELFISENTVYEFDFWKTGFEGCNSFGGWLLYKEIEYLKFPAKLIVKDKPVSQNLLEIKNLIDSVGKFDYEITNHNLYFNCYKK